MKKLIVLALFLAGIPAVHAQEVKTEIEIVDKVKTVFMTINADRFQDLKDFDWRTNLTNVFKDVPEDAIVGIRVNIMAKQLTNDIATLPNKLSIQEIGTANKREEILRSIVSKVQLFIEDEQQGSNVD
ncbi:hypothetical protein MG290_04405 [Flavobacterium sp. CBA20B-1]|uniref:hypothetical protein n=1 Tax=unclassified Flavobacterium TaxID=196869 RepID=UPI0022248B48|nr:MULTISPECIES: hypothetical protein [unclassified Flavobacterium]WCM42932.1 hypothetical protein MG290_04405 [Flavobacterium sp. CBA20B-1]